MINKNEILYDEIASTDAWIEPLIRTLNKFDYWATSQCCQGHLFEWKYYPEHNRGQNPKDFAKWSAHFYIRFEVYNEWKFLELSGRIQKEVMKITNEYLFIGKSYDWVISPISSLIPSDTMNWSISLGEKTKQKIYDTLWKIRKVVLSEVLMFMEEYVNDRET